MDKNYKKILKRIDKGKKVKTPIFIENYPENFTVIFHEGDFKMIAFPELTVKEKQNINKFMEENKIEYIFKENGEL